MEPEIAQHNSDAVGVPEPAALEDASAGAAAAAVSAAAAASGGGTTFHDADGGDAHTSGPPTPGHFTLSGAAGVPAQPRGSNRLAYVEHLLQGAESAGQSGAVLSGAPGGAPCNVRPSLLQLKQLQGANSLASVLLPLPSADGLALSSFDCGIDGSVAPQEPAPDSIAQFRFELVRAQHVGPTGFEGRRTPLRRTARIGILDRHHHRVLGNVHAMPAVSARGRDGSAWAWRADAGGAAIVRCSKVQPDPVRGARAVHPDRAVLLVELNCAFALTAEDAATVPSDEARAAGLVDEITTSWAMINLGRCADLTKEMEITVPLYAGSPYAPVLLSKLYESDRAAAAAAGSPLRALFSRPKQPALVFRAGPLPPAWSTLPLAAAPRTLVAGADLACALAAWRLALAEALGAARSAVRASAALGGGGGSGWAHTVLGDAVLSGFLGVCRDELLLREGFMGLWAAACREMRSAQGRCASSTCDGPSGGTGAPPPADALIAALRRCTLAVAPLLHCATLPPPNAANFEEWAQRRREVVRAHLYRPQDGRGRWGRLGGGGGAGGGPQVPRHPVEPLSVLSGAEFLHRPFDVSEVRLEVGGAAAPWLAV